LSEQISKPTILPAERDSFQKLNRFFDVAELIVTRTDRLVSLGKPAAINLFLMLHLLIDLIVVLVVLLKRSG
jgi:hypothetical protein